MSRITWLHISDLHLRLPTPPEPDPLPYDVNAVALLGLPSIPNADIIYKARAQPLPAQPSFAGW
jgi:hypothetical protein